MREEEAESGLCWLDETGCILWSNTRFSLLTGYSAREAKGCQWLSFLCGPKTDEEEQERMLSSLRSFQFASVCLECYHETGRVLWLQISQQPAMLSLGPAGSEMSKSFILVVEDAEELFNIFFSSSSSASSSCSYDGMDERTRSTATELTRMQQTSIFAGLNALARVNQRQEERRRRKGGRQTRRNIQRERGRKILQWAIEGSDKGKLHAKTKIRSASAEPSLLRARKQESEIVLLTEEDMALVIESGLLWQLRHNNILRDWVWESNGSLRFRLERNSSPSPPPSSSSSSSRSVRRRVERGLPEDLDRIFREDDVHWNSVGPQSWWMDLLHFMLPYRPNHLPRLAEALLGYSSDLSWLSMLVNSGKTS